MSSQYLFIIVSAIRHDGVITGCAAASKHSGLFDRDRIASIRTCYFNWRGRARMRPSQGSVGAATRTDYRGNSIEVEAFPAAGAIKIRENASSRRSTEQEEYRARAMFSLEKLDTRETFDDGESRCSSSSHFATVTSSLVGRSSPSLGMPSLESLIVPSASLQDKYLQSIS